MNTNTTTGFTGTLPYTSTDGDHSHSLTINGGGDSETRPANVALAFMIRAT